MYSPEKPVDLSNPDFTMDNKSSGYSDLSVNHDQGCDKPISVPQKGAYAEQGQDCGCEYKERSEPGSTGPGMGSSRTMTTEATMPRQVVS